MRRPWKWGSGTEFRFCAVRKQALWKARFRNPEKHDEGGEREDETKQKKCKEMVQGDRKKVLGSHLFRWLLQTRSRKERPSPPSLSCTRVLSRDGLRRDCRSYITKEWSESLIFSKEIAWVIRIVPLEKRKRAETEDSARNEKLSLFPCLRDG